MEFYSAITFIGHIHTWAVVLFDHSFFHHLQLPVQCDITIDTPTQTICSEPDGKETGDLPSWPPSKQSTASVCVISGGQPGASQSEEGEAAIGT